MKYKKLLVIIPILFIFPILSYADEIELYSNTNSFNTLETVTSTEIFEIPKINAKYGLIFDRNSKRVLYGKNENIKCKMASTTKIMTAIIVLENCRNLNDIVTISKKSARNRRIQTWIIHK